jgi:hypothetical protein
MKHVKRYITTAPPEKSQNIDKKKERGRNGNEEERRQRGGE